MNSSRNVLRPPVQVPVRSSDGNVVWINKYPSHLGDFTTTASNIQAGAALVSTAQDAAGQRPTNDTLNKISAIAGTAAALTAEFPPAAIVLTIVSIAAKVLSGVFGGGPTTEQQLRSLNNTNDDLRAQIDTIDSQIAKVSDGLKSMYSALQANGFNTSQLNGFGAIYDNLQETQLQAQANSSLQKILAQKGAQLQSLLQTYTSVVQQVDAAINTKTSGSQIILWTLLGLATLGLGAYVIGEIKRKEE